MAVNIEIDTELFASIGTMMPTEPSAISPFDTTPEQPVSDTQLKQLHELGITTESGKLHKDWYQTFSTLNCAHSLTSVRVVGVAGRIEWVFYADHDDTSSVCIVQRDGVMSITRPGDKDLAVEWLCDVLGLSALSRAGFALEIAQTEALVLAAMIDSYRHRCLQGMIDANRSQHPGLTLDEIVGSVNSDRPRPLGVTHLVRELLPQLESVGREDVEAALVSLSKAGHLRVQGDRYIADADVAAVADGLPVVHQVVSVTHATNLGQDDSLEYSTFRCLQGSPHDVLCVEAADSTVRFETSSTALIIARARILLDQVTQATSDVTNWQPTHTIPPSGLAARQAPNATDAVVATLDPLLEVVVVDRKDEWARVVCSNEWNAWVDGRELRSIER